MSTRGDLATPHRRPPDEVARSLGVDPDRGLDASTVEERRSEHGRNVLRIRSGRPVWRILVDQFADLVIALLAAAGVVSFLLGQVVEAAAIVAALLANAVIGFVTEFRAQKSMESLRDIQETTARVRRDGGDRTIPAVDLVPGDVLLLERGEIVAADVRLFEASRLHVDESPLTGESVPVSKGTAPVDDDVPLAGRTSMAYKGTAVTRGSGAGLVVATGRDTEVGRISELVEEAGGQTTPLQRRLGTLGRRLIWVTLTLAALVAAAGLVAGRDARTVIETAVVLGVAAVPEGLPIVASLALARGVHRMARHNALVERLSAVEALGAAGAIMTDKTGTLTEGRMRVARLAGVAGMVELDHDDGTVLDPDTSEAERAAAGRLLAAAAVCTEADLDDEGPGGDPIEIALLEAADQLDTASPGEVVGSVPFDRDARMMAVFVDTGDGTVEYVKGSPEAVFAASCDVAAADGPELFDEEQRRRWEEANDELASAGLRVLAVACKPDADPTTDEPYRELTLLGLTGLIDPARADVADAVAECRRAGIRVVMITGDQPLTAQAIASEIGIGPADDLDVATADDLSGPDGDEETARRLRTVDVFARLTPEDKLDLVTMHQDAGTVVAVTGDGVNDAPALEQADIGIAMGERGTDVARDAADMVLIDDAFATIVEAVRYGRTIFGNIRKFIVYLLSGNLGEILAVAAATVAGLPIPLLPLQILYINFVSDVFPALALGVGPADDDVMDRAPRDPEEPVLTRGRWLEIGMWGGLIAAIVMGVLLVAHIGLDLPPEETVTITFLTFGLGRLWHVLNMRRPGSRIVVNQVTSNPYVWAAVGLGVVLMAISVFLPPAASLLSVETPTAGQWGLIAAGSLAVLGLGQAAIAIRSIMSSGGRAGD